MRVTPPSEPSNHWPENDGLNTNECWSGWIEPNAYRHGNPRGANAHWVSFGRLVASAVMSVNVRLLLLGSGFRFAVRICQLLYVAGYGLPFPAGGNAGTGGSPASSVAEGWFALSRRQKDEGASQGDPDAL